MWCQPILLKLLHKFSYKKNFYISHILPYTVISWRRTHGWSSFNSAKEGGGRSFKCFYIQPRKIAHPMFTETRCPWSKWHNWEHTSKLPTLELKSNDTQQVKGHCEHRPLNSHGGPWDSGFQLWSHGLTVEASFLTVYCPWARQTYLLTRQV